MLVEISKIHDGAANGVLFALSRASKESRDPAFRCQHARPAAGAKLLVLYNTKYHMCKTSRVQVILFERPVSVEVYFSSPIGK